MLKIDCIIRTEKNRKLVFIHTSTHLHIHTLKRHIHTFFIRLFNWEYWPAKLVYIPVMVYYLILSVKARSFFYYSASNPSIETGGMFAESKWKVLKLIPRNYYPDTVLIPAKTNFENVK